MLSSLLDEFAGKVDLIYIDPPFATGADFSYRTQVGDVGVEKLPSMMEVVAYRDMWRDGLNSYIEWFAPFTEWLSILLNPQGSFYLHCDPTVSHYLKTLTDSALKNRNFRSEIVWKRRADSHNLATQHMGRIHDIVLFYAKSEATKYNIQYEPYDDKYIKSHYKHRDAKGLYRLLPCNNESGGNRAYDFKGVTGFWRFSEENMRRMYADGLLVQLRPGSVFYYKKYLDDAEGVKIQDIWDNVAPARGKEYLGYPTQKPEALLERIIKASSNEGDLVLDCFVGSGTTAAVAEKLGRRWIGVDIGRFAIQTTRKRLLDIPSCRPFEVQNLGKYERKYWQVARTSDDARAGGVTLTFDSSPIKGEGDMVADDEGSSGDAIEGYVRFILDLYKSQPMLGQFSYLHGIREGRAVHVGATDSPVSSAELQATVAECAANGFRALDILGWEWEMGLNPALKDELSRTFGVDIRLLYIPREILDQRNIDAGDVNFFELSVANVGVSSPYSGAVEVELTGFIPAVDEYMQARLTDMPTEWSDWIDYWSVDFEYDGEVFVNQWQSYRTRRERELSLVSDPHEYEHSGLKRIVVKVIDIFGNDATVGLDFDAEE